MANKEKLKDLFDQRDHADRQLTQQILEQIDHVTAAVQIFLNIGSESSTDDGELQWENVTFTNEAYVDSGGLIFLVGTVYYQDQFTNIVRIGIPLDKAAEGTKEDVLEFLQANSTTNQNENFDELTDELSEELPEEFDYQQESSQTDQSIDWNQTFDTDQLTEHQREQLRLYTLTVNNDGDRTN